MISFNHIATLFQLQLLIEELKKKILVVSAFEPSYAPLIETSLEAIIIFYYTRNIDFVTYISLGLVWVCAWPLVNQFGGSDAFTLYFLVDKSVSLIL